MTAIIIGVDPGSSASPGGGTGIAWLTADEQGCCTLQRAKHESLAAFCVRLRDEVEGLLPVPADGSIVVVEQPFVHPRKMGVALSLLRVAGVVEEVATRMGAAAVSVPPPALRTRHNVKAKGKAGKLEMISAMKARGHTPANEHEADAWACVEHAMGCTIPSA